MQFSAIRSYFLVFLFFITGKLAAQNNYLQQAYHQAGDAKTLANITQWRMNEKQLILTGIQQFPENIKKELITAADLSLKQLWPTIKLSDYSEYNRNGNRVNFESLYLGRRAKLSVLCAGELASGKGKYLNEIANGLWMIMEETSWVLPAHHYTATMKTDPDPTQPTIDLFAAETAAHLAWVKLLLEKELDSISPALSKRITTEINNRIIKPYLATNDYWWMGLNTKRKQNNWNIWINSNLLKVAVIVENDPGRQATMIDKLIRSADKFLDTYQPDGGCDEGPAYWTAAGGCLGEFLGVLHRVSSGKLNFQDNQLIKNIGTYIYKVHIEGSRFVNFADAPGSSIPDPGRVYNFGEMFNDQQLKSFASYLFQLSGKAGRALNSGSIISFANNVRVYQALVNAKPQAPLLQENWLPNLQVVNLREQTGSSKGLSFMAKAGNNNESHNHNDVGNFMVYADGDPVLIDLGKGTYTKQTFSSDRYQLWYIQSQWHNCPIINGIDQQAGPNFTATNILYKKGKTSTIFAMDLAAAYPKNAEVKSWNREFNYSSSTRSLILKEQYELAQYKAPIALSFIACKAPVKEKEGIIKLTSYTGKATVQMTYDPTLFDGTIEEKPVNDGSLEGIWGKTVYRITLKSKNEKLKGQYEVRFK